MGKDESRPGETRDRLLRAALMAFAEKGFEAVGIREIARRAETNSALVQYHFGGKDGLYLDVLRWIAAEVLTETVPLPALTPEDRDGAIEGLRAYARLFMRDLQACHLEPGSSEEAELRQGALALWSREMHHPRPSTAAFILETVRPYMRFLEQCIHILRPDLDEEGILHAGICIQGPMLFLHDHLELVGLIRGRPVTAADLDLLESRFVEFSLRGLGLSGRSQEQGA